MIQPNSQPKNKHIDRSINFTFSNPKPQSKTINKMSTDLTSAQKRGLGMWLDTVLEHHSDDFIRGLKGSRKFTVVGLSSYLRRYYAHLNNIVQYYIIASLIDYERIITEKQEENNNEKQCIFINIVIQELTNRFFRESQWLHKISYLPIYSIFPLLDQYSKGYTTVNELRNVVKNCLSATVKKSTIQSQNQQRSNPKKQKLLYLKLHNNIEHGDGKIYQENIEQLMLRVNLVNFEQKSGPTSKRYETIRQVLNQHEQLMTQRYEKQCQEMLIKEIKEKEELQIMKQNFQIKYRSNTMAKTNNQTINKNHISKDEPIFKDRGPESIFSTLPYYSSNFSGQKPDKKETIDFSVKKRQGVNNPSLSYKTRLQTHEQAEQILLQQAVQQMKQNLILQQNVHHQQFISKNVKQIEKNNKTLQYRNTIIQQLQFIRQEKKSNRFRLLNYI